MADLPLFAISPFPKFIHLVIFEKIFDDFFLTVVFGCRKNCSKLIGLGIPNQKWKENGLQFKFCCLVVHHI